MRQLFAGAELIKSDVVDFRVYAPKHNKVEVHIIENLNHTNKPVIHSLKSEGGGYFSASVSGVGKGHLYKFKLGDDERLYPDPFSRYQPEGPHNWSEIIDPSEYNWTDQNWAGVKKHRNIIYEMHIGTFTKHGGYQSAKEKLNYLRELGITVIEIMPLAEFSGNFGWGYDGVDLYAPYHMYGRPNDLKDFINTAHSIGIGVILDVVYNHLGPDGNYIREFTNDFFSKVNRTDWGEALNFDGKGKEFVRNFVRSNAGYWVKEYHFDGLRIDATQDIIDRNNVHIFTEIEEEIRTSAPGRYTFIVVENEPQNSKLILPKEEGGFSFDAMWNDDFHHEAMVALTGKREAYYTDYKGTPQEFISAVKYGFIYQGQYYKWQRKKRGSPTFNCDGASFINFIQNHDQIANSGHGSRAHVFSNIGTFKALTSLMILGPGTPMLFQGQEFNSSSPFYYFANHKKELAVKVFEGRLEFLKQFRSVATEEMISTIPDPGDIETFLKSIINIEEKEKNKGIYLMHKDLIKIKKDDPVISLQDRRMIEGAVIGEQCFVIRYLGKYNDDRLLVVNLGIDLDLLPLPEPLLAPVPNKRWKIYFSTENVKYGGTGTAALETNSSWMIPGKSAVLLEPAEMIDEKDEENNE